MLPSGIPCSKGVSSRLANRDYQDFLIKELLAFIKKTGSMGMGFDYTFINDPSASAYSQWAGWRRILSTVLAEGPAGLQVIPPIATLPPPLSLKQMPPLG